MTDSSMQKSELFLWMIFLLLKWTIFLLFKKNEPNMFRWSSTSYYQRYFVFKIPFFLIILYLPFIQKTQKLPTPNKII